MPAGILSNLREQQSHLWLPQAPFAAWMHAHPCFWLCSLVFLTMLPEEDVWWYHSKGKVILEAKAFDFGNSNQCLR